LPEGVRLNNFRRKEKWLMNKLRIIGETFNTTIIRRKTEKGREGGREEGRMVKANSSIRDNKMRSLQEIMQLF